MPFNWQELTSYEQIELVLGNVDGLDDDDRDAILAEWGEGNYNDSPNPESSAFADLQAIAVRRLLAKQGRQQLPKIARLALDRGEPRSGYSDS